MAERIFLSYVRLDEEEVEQIKLRLQVWGYEVWFDKSDLSPGDNWDRTVHDAIRASKAFLACVSKFWLDDQRYVHREVEMALRVQSTERPDLLVIPLQLDKAVLPTRLSMLHSVDMTTSNAFRDLFGVLGRSFPELRTHGGEGLGDLLRVIEVDPWPPQKDSPSLEALFEHFRTHAINRSEQFVLRGDWNAVLRLWAPVEENEYFWLNHPLWKDKDLYLLYFQQAKIDIVVSHIRLSEQCQSIRGADFQQHVQAAFRLISEIIGMEPFDEDYSNGSDAKVPTNMAVAKNMDYRDFTLLVLGWLDWWGSALAQLGGLDQNFFTSLRTDIVNRSSALVALRERDEGEG